jgi:hypothetical protein
MLHQSVDNLLNGTDWIFKLETPHFNKTIMWITFQNFTNGRITRKQSIHLHTKKKWDNYVINIERNKNWEKLDHILYSKSNSLYN